MTDSDQERRAELRRQAEAKLREHGLDWPWAATQDRESLLEELYIHQVELDIQNEELRLAQKQLELSQQWYQAVYDHAPVGYFVLDLDSGIVSINRAGASQLGYPAGAVTGKRFERFVAPLEREAFHAYWQQVVSTATRQTAEFQVLRADALPFHAYVESTFHALDELAPARILTAVIDTSEQQRLQEAYRQVVEHSLQGLAVFQNSRLVFTNPALVAITGYPAEELLALTLTGFHNLFHPDDRAMVEQNLLKLMDNGLDFRLQLETRLIHRSGRTRWLEIYLSRIPYQHQAAIQIACVDITGRKQAEQALLETQRFLERITNIAPNLIYIYDLVEGVNVYVNEQVSAILGYTLEDFHELGKNFTNALIHPDDLPATSAQLRQIASGELTGPMFEQEYRVRHANGQWCWLLVKRTVFSYTADGLPRQILGLAQDITRRKAIEAEKTKLLGEIRRQHKEVRALSARLAETRETERQALSRELHDQIGQNLAVLSFNLTFVRDRLAELTADKAIDLRLGDSLRLVEETTDRVRDLLADLRPPMLEEYGLAASLKWYGEKFAARTGLDIVVDDQTNGQRLNAAVEIGLFRIFQEALVNVARHAHAAAIRTTLEQADSRLRLVIADDGTGFEVTDLAKPQQLGLVTMRERADILKGQFHIESLPGQGTTIRVEVPTL